jgi:hypothetical protein
LNWDEENRRTERGLALRLQQKEDRKLRKMAAAENPQLVGQVYDVLMNPTNHDHLSALASDPHRRNFNQLLSTFYWELNLSHPQHGNYGAQRSPPLR